MPWLRLNGICIGFATAAVLLAGTLPAPAQTQHDFPEEGTVISATLEHGHVYTIETDANILQVLCVSLNPFRQTPPTCKTGDRPIALHDKLHLRREGDMAYIPGAGTGEQRLVILSTELKILPPLPDTPPLAPESAAVLGLGLQTRTSQEPAGPTPPSTAPSAGQANCSPSTSSGPVLATPVTGGPPVEVIPTGPVTGGTVTGVPVTGGPPITAIPVAPVSSADCTSAANTPMSPAPTAAGMQWVHFVRVQTSAHVYDLACVSKSCSLEHNPIHLGDLLTLRVEKKAAYLARFNASANTEQKFEILAMRSINDPPTVPLH